MTKDARSTLFKLFRLKLIGKSMKDRNVKISTYLGVSIQTVKAWASRETERPIPEAKLKLLYFALKEGEIK